MGWSNREIWDVLEGYFRKNSPEKSYWGDLNESEPGKGKEHSRQREQEVQSPCDRYGLVALKAFQKTIQVMGIQWGGEEYDMSLKEW